MKFFSTLLITLITVSTFAQNISGKAYYESKTTVKMDEIGRKGMDENMKKMIAERMKSYLEKTYILTFNGNESIYKEEEKLETGNSGGMMAMMMGSFSAGIQYKNLETKQILEEREFFGKQFLINDTITNLDWTLEKESKQIGQYVAFKATAIKQIDANDLSMARRRKSDDKKVEDEKEATETVSDSTETKDPFDEIEVPKEVIVTAWYTPMIPIKNGPGEYAGLPGLILELNVYRTTILCSKIVMNPKESEEIKAPKKGKEVSRAEYNKIVKAKMEEMRENFRNSGGRKGGGGHMRSN
ncbi:MAG: ribonuclease Z [Flavobacterium sp.]|nr:MAG: ribonuclease Z [Flavobacterium sp.]